MPPKKIAKVAKQNEADVSVRDVKQEQNTKKRKRQEFEQSCEEKPEENLYNSGTNLGSKRIRRNPSTKTRSGQAQPLVELADQVPEKNIKKKALSQQDTQGQPRCFKKTEKIQQISTSPKEEKTVPDELAAKKAKTQEKHAKQEETKSNLEEPKEEHRPQKAKKGKKAKTVNKKKNAKASTLKDDKLDLVESRPQENLEAKISPPAKKYLTPLQQKSLSEIWTQKKSLQNEVIQEENSETESEPEESDNVSPPKDRGPVFNIPPHLQEELDKGPQLKDDRVFKKELWEEMQSLLKEDSKFLKIFRMLRERTAEVKSVLAKCKHLKQLRCSHFISQFNCGDGADSNQL